MIVKNKNQFVGNLKIDLKEALGSEEDAYIVVRDCQIGETVLFKVAKDEQEQLGHLRELLPSLIVDHNFYNEDGSKMSNSDLTDVLFESPWYIINEINQEIMKFMFRRLDRSRGDISRKI